MNLQVPENNDAADDKTRTTHTNKVLVVVVQAIDALAAICFRLVIVEGTYLTFSRKEVFVALSVCARQTPLCSLSLRAPRLFVLSHISLLLSSSLLD